jgi:cytochrome c peroxidase
LLTIAFQGLSAFENDSVLSLFKDENHFLFCNRLFLLNLATIYTTGFDCPDSSRILPELIEMTMAVKTIYQAWLEEHPNYLEPLYLQHFTAMEGFLKNCGGYDCFNHFLFIRDYVNPLFSINQKMIREKRLKSASRMDYSLNSAATSIYSKTLYAAQSTKGVFGQITNSDLINEIRETGKLLFNDPILSGDNQRSCASCHALSSYFTDTSVTTHMQFGKTKRLERNTPTLLNSSFNHLLMQDGKHYSLLAQAKAVITNPIEMNSKEEEVVDKVMSCPLYKKRLLQWCRLTPAYPKPTIEHITSALILYYTTFDRQQSPFDLMMNQQMEADPSVVKGFNLFMGKAQCGTCHFAPLFNGVKPPYTGSEFEVLGVPSDTSYSTADADLGRSQVFDVPETRNAFRTGTLRNVAVTGPYMHNGVFKTLDEVIDFYDQGGGAGRGLSFPNQTLSAEKLNLTKEEKTLLITFLRSLTEAITTHESPIILPSSRKKSLKSRTFHGVY